MSLADVVPAMENQQAAPQGTAVKTPTTYIRITKAMADAIAKVDPNFNAAAVSVLRPKSEAEDEWMGVRLSEYFKSVQAIFVGERAYVRDAMLRASALLFVECAGARPLLLLKKGSAAGPAAEKKPINTKFRVVPLAPLQKSAATETTQGNTIKLTTEAPTMRLQILSNVQDQNYHDSVKNFVLRQNFGFVSAEVCVEELPELKVKYLMAPLAFIETDVVRERSLTAKIAWNTPVEKCFEIASKILAFPGVDAAWISNGNVRVTLSEIPSPKTINPIKLIDKNITQIIPDVFPVRASIRSSSAASARSSSEHSAGSNRSNPQGPVAQLQSVSLALTGKLIEAVLKAVGGALLTNRSVNPGSALIRLPPDYKGPDVIFFDNTGEGTGGTACSLTVLRGTKSLDNNAANAGMIDV